MQSGISLAGNVRNDEQIYDIFQFLQTVFFCFRKTKNILYTNIGKSLDDWVDFFVVDGYKFSNPVVM